MTEDEMPILRKKLKKEVFMIEVLRKKIQAVRDTDVNALLFGGIGLLGIFLGSIVINLNPPSYQIGYPTMALGLTCFIFAVSIDNSKKTGKKMESILENQHLILEEIKKNRGSE